MTTRGGLKKVVDDGDFTVYLASNEKQARLYDKEGSIRSAFTTPLGDELDLDDNWEVCLKSITVRNIQNVVGNVTLFKENLDGSFDTIDEREMPPADYHDTGDILKEIYQWFHETKVGEDLPGDGEDARYIYAGTGDSNGTWCDFFSPQDIHDIHHDSNTVEEYFQKMSEASQTRVISRRSFSYRTFGDGYNVAYDGASDGWHRTFGPGDDGYNVRIKWSWDAHARVMTLTDAYWAPWIAIPDKVAKMLHMDKDHFNDYYILGSNLGSASVHRMSFVINNVLYHCFYMTSYYGHGTLTKITFTLKSQHDPLPLLITSRGPVMNLNLENNDKMKLEMKENHYVWIQSKEGDTIFFFGRNDDDLIEMNEFLKDCLDREALVNAKSDLWNVAIPGLNFQERYRSHEDDLKPGSINPCVYVSRLEQGTVFLQFPQEGRYRRLKRLTEQELSVEITDSSTKKHVLFWTGYTIVCLHFRHRILNPDLFLKKCILRVGE